MRKDFITTKDNDCLFKKLTQECWFTVKDIPLGYDILDIRISPKCYQCIVENTGGVRK